MLRTFVCLLTCLVMSSIARAKPPTVLQDYLRKPESVYKWNLVSKQSLQFGTVYNLRMTSLTWQRIVWKHNLQIFVPEHTINPHYCTLMNSGGSGGADDEKMGLYIAKESGSIFANLYDIPNQPLFGGRTEGELLVYTWLKYIETGDSTWPLQLPMSKAVIQAMNTVQALAKNQDMPAINEFMITGASKRGWNAWLDGASGDQRIKAIAPMVIDVLNIPVQMKHQYQMYGNFSNKIPEYTEGGIQQKLKTPMGHKLVQLEDPYTYRKILTLPKLIILGSNDPFWTVDSLNIYWSHLRGAKWIMDDPNSGHALNDRARVMNTLTAFARTIAAHKLFPKMLWKYDEHADGVTLSATSKPKAIAAKLWHVYAPTWDFRWSHWTSEPMLVNSKGVWKDTQTTPSKGCEACYGELTYEQDGKEYTLSTQVHVMGSPEK